MKSIMQRGIHRYCERLLGEGLPAIALAIGVATAIAVPSAHAANGSVTYSYDALGRLLTANYDTGVCIVYSYDANGNRTSQQILVVSGASTGVWGCFNWNGANWGP